MGCGVFTVKPVAPPKTAGGTRSQTWRQGCEITMGITRQWSEIAARGIEVLAVAIMVSFILIGTAGFLIHSLKGIEGAYDKYRTVLAKTLLVGLELMVAADIVNTVAFELTLNNLALLGCLVAVRTALGWTLTVEVEGHWPWQHPREIASVKQQAE
jgi:uncharacterized membrane protein